jgi:hypothetical protein
MRDSTQPAKKRRRSRRGREIQDAEIARILEKHLPPSWFDEVEWARLGEATAADTKLKPVPSGFVNLDEWFSAYKAQVDRAKDRLRATLIRKQVYHLAALLEARGVAEPTLRAANYYAPIWREDVRKEGRALFQSGNALLTWVWRTLSGPA